MSQLAKNTYNDKASSFFFMIEQNWQRALFYLTTLIIIGLSVYSSSITNLSGDVAWYLISTTKLLNGESMLEAYFDTNPPMSFIIYIPVILMHWLTGISLSISLQSYIILITLGLHLMALRLLRDAFGPEKLIPYSTILISLTSILVFKNIPGIKEQFLAIQAIPLLSAMYYLYSGKTEHKFSAYILIALCSILMLVKPHYFLIPACVFLYDAIKQKRISRITINSGAIMAASLALYAAIAFIFFPSFFSITLQTSSELYISHMPALDFMNAPPITIWIVFASLCLCFGLNKADPNKSFFELLLLSAFPAYFIFAIQGKGFMMHMIPYIHLSIIATTIVLIQAASKQMPPKALLFGFNILMAYVAFTTVTGHTFREGPFYKNITHASRFPTRWILDGIETYDAIPTQTRSKYIDMFGHMFVADIEKYKPDILFLYDTTKPIKNALYSEREHFGILHYLKDHEKFQTMMQDYYKTDQVFKFRYGDLENQHLIYNIYKLKDAP